MKRIAITGAAAGIGRALAQCFGSRGWTVVGIDADAAASEETRFDLVRAGCEVDFLTTDLARPAARAKLLQDLEARGPLDAFVLNAGINRVGPFAKADLAAERRVLEVNLVAPLALTAGLLRGERLARRASLVFVSSLSHYVGYPGAPAYAASKDGIAAYARSLAAGTQARGLHVLTVFPGPTRTEHARRHAPPGASEARRMPPEVLAERVFRAVRRRRRVLIPGLGNRTAAAVGHVLPRVTEGFMRKVGLPERSDA